jgi:hypothetical protein
MTLSNIRRVGIGAVAVLGIAFGPSVAAAQGPTAAHSAADIAQARELFTQAMRQRQQGDVRGSLDKFTAAHALGGTPLTGLELGRTQLNLGSLVEARESFLAVARIPVGAQETRHSAEAREEAALLAEKTRARIPSLTVQVAGVQAATAAVVIDGVTIPAAALGAPRLLNPGPHTLKATSHTGLATAEVSLKEGETRTIELTLVADHVASAAPPSQEPPVLAPTGPAAAGSYPLKPLVFAGIGVAIVGVGVGSITGVMALSKASTVNQACPNHVCGTVNESSTIQAGQTLGTVSTAGFVVAGVGAAAAIFALVYPHGSHASSTTATTISPWVSPTGAGLNGTF